MHNNINIYIYNYNGVEYEVLVDSKAGYSIEDTENIGSFFFLKDGKRVSKSAGLVGVEIQNDDALTDYGTVLKERKDKNAVYRLYEMKDDENTEKDSYMVKVDFLKKNGCLIFSSDCSLEEFKELFDCFKVS